MRARQKQASKAVEQLFATLDALNLDEVHDSAWEALSEANGMPEMSDFNVAMDHITERDFHELAANLPSATSSFWDRLARSSSTSSGACVLNSTRQRGQAFQHAHALVAVLAQAVAGSSFRVATAASTAYLALLGTNGARSHWGTLVQPVLFHWLSTLFKPLCSLFKHIPVVDDEESDAEEMIADDGHLDEADEDSRAKAAQQLLSLLVTFLQSSASSLPPSIMATLVDRLTLLMLHPNDEDVAKLAASALSALIAGSGETRNTAASIVRSVLPAILMNQEKKFLSQAVVPRMLQQTRAVALDFLKTTMQSYPALLGLTISFPNSDKGAQAIRKRSADEESKGVDLPILAILQHLMISTPERAEWRNAAADSVVVLLICAVSTQAKQPGIDKNCIGILDNTVDYVERLLLCERGAWRGIAVEVIALLMERFEQLIPQADAETQTRLLARLLAALVRRCSDVVATVRGRAFACVASIVSTLSKLPQGLQIWRELLWNVPDSNHSHVANLFRRAGTDDHAKVRRAALNLLDTVLPTLCNESKLNEQTILSRFDLEVLSRLATDTSVIVRKAAISSMTLLLQNYPLEVTALLWVTNVLPLALDSEGTVIERVLVDSDSIIFAPLCSENGLETSQKSLPSVLRLIESDSESVELLRCVIRCQAKRDKGTRIDKLMATVLEDAERHLSLSIDEWSFIVWVFFEELAALGAVKLFPSAPGIVLKAWERIDRSRIAHDSRQSRLKTQVLRCLEPMASSIPREYSAQLLDLFVLRLSSLLAPSDEISIILRVVDQLESSLSKSVGASRPASRHAIVKALDAKLEDFVEHAEDSGGGRWKAVEDVAGGLCRCLFTIGQLSLSSPAHAEVFSNKAISHIEAIATNTVFDRTRVKASNSLVRSHAFAALGKICLRREDVAKKLVELFVLHLTERESIAIRNNVLLVLRDLCERYTSLVDRFVTSMASLLCDKSNFLRKQAVMTLASLFSESFVHFRGHLVLRFLYVLGDSCDEIRKLAQVIIVRVLLPQNAAVFPKVFSDVICMLNGWSGHPGFKGAVGNQEFMLQQQPERRLMVYTFMLSLMTNEQKLTIYSQLVNTFLGVFLEGETPLKLPRTRDDAGGEALHDVLNILVAKELHMCLTTKRSQDEGDDSKEVDGASNALKAMIKEVICDHVMPTLTQLKNVMETLHSPFLGQLRRCICVFSHEFSDDLKSVLTGDVQLANEVAFDLGVEEPQEKAGKFKRRRSLGTAMVDESRKSQPLVEQPVRKKVRMSSQGSARISSTDHSEAQRELASSTLIMTGEDEATDSSRPMALTPQNGRRRAEPSDDTAKTGCRTLSFSSFIRSSRAHALTPSHDALLDDGRLVATPQRGLTRLRRCSDAVASPGHVDESTAARLPPPIDGQPVVTQRGLIKPRRLSSGSADRFDESTPARLPPQPDSVDESTAARLPPPIDDERVATMRGLIQPRRLSNESQPDVQLVATPTKVHNDSTDGFDESTAARLPPRLVRFDESAPVTPQRGLTRRGSNDATNGARPLSRLRRLV